MAGSDMVQGAGVNVYHDYTLSADNKISFVNTLTGASDKVKGDIRLTKFAATGAATNPAPTNPSQTVVIPEQGAAATSNGNIAIIIVSVAVGATALIGASLLVFRKRKGGK